MSETETTYWNGEPCPAKQVWVIVGDTDFFPLYWARHLVGQEREAVRVDLPGGAMYLDNHEGEGWAKVTEGRGAPHWGHGELVVEREV